jgi:hypothetical protein
MLGLISLPFNIAWAVGPTASTMTAGSYDDVVRFNNGFITANRWGVELFETNDAGQLLSVSRAFSEGRSEFVDASGDLVVVSNLDGSLEIFRMEGRRFKREARLQPGFHPVGIKIVENYLYVGGLETALTIYDISVPSSPVFVSDVSFSGYPHEFEIRNDTMFVAAYQGGVVVLGISNLEQPEVLDQFFLPDYVYGIEIDGYLIYACAHRAGLYTLDLRWNGEPPVIGHNGDFGSAREARLVEEDLLVLDGYGALRMVDISRPSVPEIIWSEPLDFNSNRFDLAGDTVFVANWIHGVKLLKINDKIGADPIDEKIAYSACKSIAIHENTIYAAAGTGGLLTYDSDLKPALCGDLETGGNCLEIRLSNNIGFLSSDDNGLNIVDLSDPTDLKVISNFKSEGWVKSSSYNGEYGFLANWQGIITVDLSDLSFPTEEAFYDTYYGSSKIEFRNDTVFVASSSGLELYEASSPDDVVFLNRFESEYPSTGISLRGREVALSAGYSGVYLLDLGDDLSLLSHVVTGGKAMDSELSGNRMYIAEADSGVSVWDISYPDFPVFLFKYGTAGRACDLAFIGDRIYVADYYGITILDPVNDAYGGEQENATGGDSPGIVLFPNPAREKGTVRLDLSTPGPVSMELFDILGRKVGDVYDGFVPAGQISIEWKKRDLPTGCYFLSVRGQDFRETRSLTIIK